MSVRAVTGGDEQDAGEGGRQAAQCCDRPIEDMHKMRDQQEEGEARGKPFFCQIQWPTWIASDGSRSTGQNRWAGAY